MRQHRYQAVRWIAAFFLIVCLLTLLTWANHRYASQNPGGTDFLTSWVATRSFLGEGTSPYSDEVATQAQNIAYGRDAEPDEPELRFRLPLYSILVILPFSLIKDFLLARALWMTLLEVSLLAVALLSVRLTNWRVHPALLGLFLLFSAFWFHAMHPLIMGDTVILVTLMITLALLAIRSGADEIAGILLGLATIIPQLVIVILAFITIWAISQRRWKILLWTAMTVILLSAVSALLLPDWIIQFIRELLRTAESNQPGSPAEVLTRLLPALGRQVGVGFSIGVAILMIVEWIFALRKDFPHFLWAACFTLAASQWVGIRTDPGNFILLFPALALVFATWDSRWRSGGRILIVISLLALFGGIWAIYLSTTDEPFTPVQAPLMFLLLPIFLLIALYWVRWWAINPPSMLYDFSLINRR